MKKTLALIASAAVAFSMGACSSDSDTTEPDAGTTASESADDADDDGASADDPDVIGINELPVGDSGPQTSGPLTIDAIYFQAVDMEHGTMAMPPASESDMHFEIDVATTEDAAEWGYEADQFLPYLDITVIATNTDTGDEVDLGTMMPMIASDGPHYGNNISLDPGNYTVEVTVTSPGDSFMLHTGNDSSGVKGRFWTEPLTFTFENWQWDGQLI